MLARTPASKRVAKAIRGSHGPRANPSSKGKGKSKENQGKFQGLFKGTKSENKGVGNGHCRS